MTIQKTGDWPEARVAVARMGARMVKASEKATKQEAQLFRAMVVRAFNSRGKSNGVAWKPIKPATKKRKRSSKPLIDSGQLRNSVQIVERGDSVFVGVPSFARRKDGGPLVSIAAVHEYGKKIAITYPFAGIVIIDIPERSFIRSTAKFHFKPNDTRTRYFARIGVIMGPGWAMQVPPSARALAAKGKAAAKGAG